MYAGEYVGELAGVVEEYARQVVLDRLAHLLDRVAAAAEHEDDNGRRAALGNLGLEARAQRYLAAVLVLLDAVDEYEVAVVGVHVRGLLVTGQTRYHHLVLGRLVHVRSLFILTKKIEN